MYSSERRTHPSFRDGTSAKNIIPCGHSSTKSITTQPQHLNQHNISDMSLLHVACDQAGGGKTVQTHRGRCKPTIRLTLINHIGGNENHPTRSQGEGTRSPPHHVHTHTHTPSHSTEVRQTQGRVVATHKHKGRSVGATTT